MLAQRDIDDLIAARHADPFGALGMHTDAQGLLWVRALLPDAERVEVIDASTAQPVAWLARAHPDGFFEGSIAGRSAFAYRFRVTERSGAVREIDDAYRFGTLLGEQELYYLGEGSHLRPWTALGAHPQTLDGVEGVRFAVWAPNAARVSVVGDFNNWDGRRHPMRVRHQAGIWELFLPGVGVGARYKYEIRAKDGAVLPLKVDPYAFAAELRPATASVVAPTPQRRSLPPSRAAANAHNAPMSIYEVHLGSWRRASDGGFLDWDALAHALPGYVAELGFTHVELLPISEHPFDGSWGYQPTGLYAPTSRFGGGEGFARFVDACHARGIGVLLDWVPGHFPTDAHGLGRFDGTALYEYADSREGFHRDWDTYIYNFSRTEVRNFLIGNALYWLECWGVDGLRVDAVASMLYRDYSRPPGEWVPNVHGGRENLEAVSLLRRANELVGAHAVGAITAAEESTAWPGVSRPVYAGGLGFHYKWNMGWMHDTLKYMSKEPVHRRWHHNQLTFGLVYAFNENFILPLSHDEVVHGKGSLLGKMPGDKWQKLANLRAYYAFMWTHPGKKLLFMGGEIAQEREWNHDRELDWGLLDDPAHRGVQHLIRDLNALYRARPALHSKDCESAGFEWIDWNDHDNSVLSYVRKGDANAAPVLVVCNFTPVPRHDFRVGVPTGGVWREVLNTDSSHYGGSNVGNGSAPLNAEPIAWNGRHTSLRLTLPPLGTVVLERV